MEPITKHEIKKALEQQARDTAYYNGHKDGDAPSPNLRGEPIWKEYLCEEAKALWDRLG